MKNKDHPYVGVDAIITDEKGYLLLVKRSEESKVFPGFWGLVSGHVEWNETVKEALAREAQEEIGVELEVIRFTGRYYDKIGRHPTETIICLPSICRIKKGIPKPLEKGTEIKWFSPEKVRNMKLAYDHKQMLIDEGLI
ncbi:MAG: NUDIX hydrolase [Candidatus Aenigmarchaeota archaeon]|nr:NUDIX hydrolase [Candidatus Aenigmarchaeota archaeon]